MSGRGGSPSFHQCGYQASAYRSSSTRPRSTVPTRKLPDSGHGSCINTSNPFYKSYVTSPHSPRKPVATVSPIATTATRRRLQTPGGGSTSTSVYSTYSSIRRRPPSFVLYHLLFLCLVVVVLVYRFSFVNRKKGWKLKTTNIWLMRKNFSL